MEATDFRKISQGAWSSGRHWAAGLEARPSELIPEPVPIRVRSANTLPMGPSALRAIFFLFLAAPSLAYAEISDRAARACGVDDNVISASHAARPVLARFATEAAFADRGAGSIRIIEFADYSCPACRALHPAWVALARANPDVRISVTEYPIYGRTLVSRATGNRTLNASRIAIAAGAQGKQLAFHDALMGVPGRVDDRAIRLAAERAGLDLALAARRAETPAIIARADANLRIAEELGLIGTPHVVVDGVLLSLQRGWTMQQVDCLVRAARTNVR